jgi:cell wall-associated NlpC family hydrolase
MKTAFRLAASLTILIGATFFTNLANAQNGYAASHYAAQQAAYAQHQAAAFHAQQNQQAWAAYHAQQQAAAYQMHMQQQAAYAAAQQQAARALPVARATAASGPLIRYDGRYASCSASLPGQIQYLINAANHLQSSPYVRGAGHGRVEDRAYDCSSSTSYALIKAGLLKRPLTSAGFAKYGQPGEGRFFTIWVKPGEHVFMTVCGLRLDTSGGQSGEGPRWRTKGRNYAGFTPRHFPGL